ncbi:MAG: cyclic nucleotide-binding domain-containing protein [Bryobacterales bacterium]|jgi:CRP-like cAMP-binding protein|nr:cyclic nucleotide-binding domain-containing protein [Bryobacterales bacterium]
MNIQDLEHILEDHPFVQGMHYPHVRTLLGCCSNQRYSPGDYLFRGGQESHEFFLLREGTVSLELYVPQHGGLRVETRGGGDLLGWSWLIKPYRWHFDAKAITDVATLMIDARCLRQKCEEDHSFGYDILKRFAALMVHDVRAMSLQLIDMHKPLRA